MNSLYALIALACLILFALALYAGRLLYQVKQQTVQAKKVREARTNTILESIHTIAFAMQQQQCNLSEGTIRLVNLLQSLPIAQPINYAETFPGIFALFDKVKDLPTHEARKKLGKHERDAQDLQREQDEADFESQILKEVAILRKSSVESLSVS
jgi:peptide subunit release factor RF-3